jgi:hypothetical protein
MYRYQAYVQGATDGRLLDAPVYSIRENDESLEFTCHFQAWDDGTYHVLHLLHSTCCFRLRVA